MAAAVFAADPDGQVGAGGAAAFDGDADQFADPAFVDRLERGDAKMPRPR
jgi:hypothetical protein